MDLIIVLLALVGSGAASDPISSEAVVVEEVRKGFPGDLAGLRPGDVLLGWSHTAGAPSRPAPLEGALRFPFDLVELGVEQLPRRSLTLKGIREGEPFAVLVPPEAQGFGLQVRPALPQPLLDPYERGRRLIADGKIEEGLSLWREAVMAAGGKKGGAEVACWLVGRVGAELSKAGRLEPSRSAYREAAACAERLGPRFAAALLEEQGATEREEGQFQPASDAFADALRIRTRMAPGSLATAACIRSIGHVEYLQGHSERAVGLYKQALSIQEAEAPSSLAAAETLVLLGFVFVAKGDLDAAEDTLHRAERIAEQAAPEGTTLFRVLTALGAMAFTRADLAGAEQLWKRVLGGYQKIAPESLESVFAQNNVGAVAGERGDFDTAEVFWRRALPLAETVEGGWRAQATLLHNLGEVAAARGDLRAAEDLLRKALALFEDRTPGTYNVVQVLQSLGHTLKLGGNRESAKRAFERALALCERAIFGGGLRADSLVSLGDLAKTDGDWKAAEDFYERALAIRERVSPASAGLAQALHGLGTVKRFHGKLDEAASLFARGIEAVEGQRGRLGGSDDARSLFASKFFGIYHDQIELLVDQGRVREAFHVLEKSRARSLLALMAERDLVLDAEIPPDLERQRRRTDADYERAQEALGRLGSDEDRAKMEQLTLQMHELRERQAEIVDQIRQASPRLAQLRYPEPLDASGVQATLGPGTALLAHSVGKERTVLFVLRGSGADGVGAITIPIGEERLRERVDNHRRLAERAVPPPEFYLEARALYDLLLRPVERRVASAKRLLLSLDGPLHKLPFAALRRNGSYLAEWKPMSIVPSGTIHAQLVRARAADGRSSDLVAFGDPLRAGGFERLAASRREVEAIGRLFPKATVYTGEKATEDRAKAIGTDVRYVHFACHGLIDERFPLHSALVLSQPPTRDERADNGLLYAWEIFERGRLDADLVTLSACRGADGTERAGEGLLGLTRAFQYAGARSVLASLWTVGDKSAADLMGRFYLSLKKGLPRDEALRRAQTAAIRAGRHPLRWAAFQLYGAGRDLSVRANDAQGIQEGSAARTRAIP